MKNIPSKFRVTFGSGPIGLIVSLVLLFIAFETDERFGFPPMSGNRFLLNSIAVVLGLLALIAVVWSFNSLPAADRGKKLCVSGAFKYVRHPLYAAFLSIFDFGLAVYFNSWAVLAWAIILHPIWHYLVRNEEKLMIDIFGEAYVEYRKTTGRFIPKFLGKKN